MNTSQQYRQIVWNCLFLTLVLTGYIGSFSQIEAFAILKGFFLIGFYSVGYPEDKYYLIYEYLEWLIIWPIIIFIFLFPLLKIGRERRLLLIMQTLILILFFAIGIKQFSAGELAGFAFEIYFFFILIGQLTIIGIASLILRKLSYAKKYGNKF